MPLYEKSEDWLHQSSLLLEARPETTRITTRYTIHPATRRRPGSKPQNDSSAPTPAPRGSLELKTYDPVSGVALKYHTVKLAEVGRLMALLGGPLATRQAGVPARPDDQEVLPDAPPATEGSGAATPVPVQAERAGGASSGAAGGGGGGGKAGKKKKGGKR